MAHLNLQPEDWPAISRRLDEALALEPEARGAWLDVLHEDVPIKNALRRLLAESADTGAGEFLEQLRS